jgi:chromosome segregation ATPase
MVPNVLTHLTAGAFGLLVGCLLTAGSRRAVRRREALRWAFERARADAERARRREGATRAELEAALRRENAARDEAETTKALAASLEAEVVAVRWEKEELEERSRAAQRDLDRTTQEITALHSELTAAVRNADASAPLPSAEPEEQIRFAAVPLETRARPIPAAPRGGRPALSLVAES